MRLTTCAEVDELTAELALDILDGEERGSAVAHIEGCRTCQRDVTRATEALETLLLLAPPVEPSPGFEARVLERLGAQGMRPRRRDRHRLRASAAAAAALLLMLLGSLLALGLAGESSGTDNAFAVTTMRTADGDDVGTAYVHRDDPGWLVIDIRDWEQRRATRYAAERSFTVRIERRDGTTRAIRTTINRDGTWTSSARTAPAIASISVVDDQGRTWCEGRFRL